MTGTNSGRSAGWRERGAYPVHLGDPAALGSADAQPRRPAADAVPARHLDGRLSGGALGVAGQERPEPVALGGRAPLGRVAGRIRSLAGAGLVGPPLRLRLRRRGPPAGEDGGAGRVHAGPHRSHAGRPEGTGRVSDRRAGKRPELAGAAGRREAPRPRHRGRDRGGRRRARLLEGARRGSPHYPPPAVLAAQGRQPAQQGAKSVQGATKADIREIPGAPTRAAAEAAIAIFVEKYGAKYPKAVECLTRDRDALLAFFDLPAEHWDHLRTTHPIESVFATVRHRTVRTKGPYCQPPPS